MTTTVWPQLDPESCYRAVASRDRRFDGVFLTAVHTTGIYCRPSCPARTPGADRVSFHPTAASAQAAGFRACKRCAPDATPGAPGWDVVADVAGRAMRLVSDGVVEREGVTGLAARLGYSPRHLTRLLREELGAGPLALARARRAQQARTLVEETDLAFADVAFAAGFASVRQFNDTVREVYALTPTAMRARRAARRPTPREPGGTGDGLPAGRVDVRLPVRTPYDGACLLAHLEARAVPGVEVVREGTYARTLDLPHGPGTVVLRLPQEQAVGVRAHVHASFALTDLRDLGAAAERVRRLVDADCDPVAVAAALEADPLLGSTAARHPGLRVPGHVDGHEVAVRAVLGQQVTLAAARGLAGRLVADHGPRVATGIAGLDRLFPRPEAVAALVAGDLPVPGSRVRALAALCAAVAAGDLVLDRGADRQAAHAALLALPGIGPWTADYVAMRALGDPDRLLLADSGTRAAFGRWGVGAGDVAGVVESWRPWRSYAQHLVWRSLHDTDDHPVNEER
ncbi:DNA-3-methyladenine glycosylase 2 family protein [Nocardioides sp. Y6]|uniref:DNA-3-methyladenine glycosylase II n=1 Tax=Nocardioides malaquae TaxID=2773426 RepID=A0ABR9RP97_9ACTN|nr:AlkA N-terminal domain-containing protein [Nocardioides malaquae]MBE7323399.1 DNA-3-methyladenine glycosylase 2 family protein [Nocardioides malaquae]